MSQLMDDFSNMVSAFTLIDYILFFILVFLSIALYRGLWVTFVRNLEERIWRAQSMVNMIPFEIIADNKKLQKSLNKADFM
jgi:hypothetical protein